MLDLRLEFPSSVRASLMEVKQERGMLVSYASRDVSDQAFVNDDLSRQRPARNAWACEGGGERAPSMVNGYFPLEDDHRRLLDAVLSGSPEMAEEAVRDHIATSLAEDLKGQAALEAANSAS